MCIRDRHNLLVGATWRAVYFLDAGQDMLRLLVSCKGFNSTERWSHVVVLKVLFHFICNTGEVVVSISFRSGLEYALKSASLSVILLTFCCGFKLDDIVLESWCEMGDCRYLRLSTGRSYSDTDCSAFTQSDHLSDKTRNATEFDRRGEATED